MFLVNAFDGEPVRRRPDSWRRIRPEISHDLDFYAHEVRKRLAHRRFGESQQRHDSAMHNRALSLVIQSGRAILIREKVGKPKNRRLCLLDKGLTKHTRCFSRGFMSSTTLPKITHTLLGQIPFRFVPVSFNFPTAVCEISTFWSDLAHPD